MIMFFGLFGFKGIGAGVIDTMDCYWWDYFSHVID